MRLGADQIDCVTLLVMLLRALFIMTTLSSSTMEGQLAMSSFPNFLPSPGRSGAPEPTSSGLKAAVSGSQVAK